MKKSKYVYRTISWMLVLLLLTENLCGCVQNNVSNNVSGNISSPDAVQIDTTTIADSISDQIEAGEFSLSEDKAEYYVVSENEADDNFVASEEEDYSQFDTEQFVYQKIYDEYSLFYETFDARVTLSDGTELYGIAYSDFAAYFECVDGEGGYFPAGFIIEGGEVSIPDGERETGLELENLFSYNDKYGFVVAYNTDPYREHFVRNGKYVKYGVDENGIIVFTEEDFSRDIVDESLGALYSYDENETIFNPDVGGDYIPVSGESLFERTDYQALEDEINEILETQDRNFSEVEIDSVTSIAQGAVSNYLLNLQQEKFLGCDVETLRKEVEKLNPRDCITILPDGNVVIEVGDEIPSEPSKLAKWTVGISCGIAFASSVAMSKFIPATTILDGAISGVAIEVFFQVVIDNNSVENINWTKVAIAATTGAIMAWLDPFGADQIGKSIAARTGNEVLAKVAGYSFSVMSNSVAAGVTNSAFAIIDEKSEEEVFDAFVTGAVIGACCTVAAEELDKAARAAMDLLKKSNPDNWLVKLADGATCFINEHQVKLFDDDLEKILAPKTVYESTQSGMAEYNRQLLRKRGGGYKDLKKLSSGTGMEVNEIPAHWAVDPNNDRMATNGPSIIMDKRDHMQTASWGSSKEAQEYRQLQKELCDKGNYKEAIDMDIADIRSKFGNKYDDAIEEMVAYAKSIGWY